MFTSVAVLTALALPAPTTGLTLENVRLTFGLLGPTRPDNKVLPGDSVIIAFEIEGVTVGPDGKVVYTTGIEVTNSAGKNIFKQPERDVELFNPLGGTRIPAFAQLELGLEDPAGEYTAKVIVTDKPSGKSQSFSQKMIVLPRGFGLARIALAADADAVAPAGLLGPGQALWVHAAILGFTRGTNKQPAVQVDLRVLDDKGVPTLKQGFTGTFDKDVPPTATTLPMRFLLSLNRPGKFTLEVKATDKVSGKISTLTLPLTVYPGER